MTHKKGGIFSDRWVFYFTVNGVFIVSMSHLITQILGLLKQLEWPRADITEIIALYVLLVIKF